jgi:hypothetical protein
MMWGMRRCLVAIAVLAHVLTTLCTAAERHWQTGTWTDVSVKRQMIDFGPGSTPFDRGRPTSSMRAMADVHVYVLETAALRLELQDVVAVNKRALEAVVGLPVTFALEKSTIYIRDADGLEHKLRVTKKTTKKSP